MPFYYRPNNNKAAFRKEQEKAVAKFGLDAVVKLYESAGLEYKDSELLVSQIFKKGEMLHRLNGGDPTEYADLPKVNAPAKAETKQEPAAKPEVTKPEVATKPEAPKTERKWTYYGEEQAKAAAALPATAPAPTRVSGEKLDMSQLRALAFEVFGEHDPSVKQGYLTDSQYVKQLEKRFSMAGIALPGARLSGPRRAQLPRKPL